MYFSKIPNVYAPYTIGGVEQYIQIKDITVNVRFVAEFLSNITAYDLYDIRDGETPELLAERFYGTPTYHWAIMLANDRYDYINDFPIASNVFEEYVRSKYGESHLNDVHHYETATGLTVDSDWVGRLAISNYTYENRLNESKRVIKVISQNVIEQVGREYAKALESA